MSRARAQAFVDAGLGQTRETRAQAELRQWKEIQAARDKEPLTRPASETRAEAELRQWREIQAARAKESIIPFKRMMKMDTMIPDGIARPPGEERGFIHKKLLKKIPGIGSIVSIGAGLVGGLIGGRGAGSDQQKQAGRDLKFGGGQGRGFGGGGIIPDLGFCAPGFRKDPITGKCTFFVGDRPGSEGFTPVGDATMGRYGAGLVPGVMELRRSVCLKGMQLANDGLCYNKSQISNKQRMWPAGRKPLLTGGDMRAISTAARAGRRLEGATKRLQRMGMMKKPTTRRLARAPHPALMIESAAAHHHSKH